MSAGGSEKVYIHEFIDIRGHNRAKYMQHMAANWSPLARESRKQLCYGVWAVLGSTGPWPQVVNMWEEDGWDGLATSFGGEAVGTGAQDPALAAWWAEAAEFRRGGFDRIVVPADWSRPIESLCGDGVRGACYAHELVRVRPGANREYLDAVRAERADALSSYGWELFGGFCTAMVDDDECILLWAIPTWQDWASAERAMATDDVLRGARETTADLVEGFHRILLVDAPLSPLRTGRQPAISDQVDLESI